MATTAELERLAALLERLGPLADKARGELIRSAEWNDLVGTVGELARAVLADDDVDVVSPHEHSEQVSLGWLNPSLRQLLTEGPLADSASQARLAKLERSLAALAVKLKALGSDQDGLRGRVSDVATKDLAREASLTTFGRRIEGIGDARDDVAEVRKSLQSVQTDVLRAIEVGQRLEINGEPIDVPGLVSRIDGLDELRERLTLPDGQLLDATEFKRQVAELETRLVTEEELDAALRTVRDVELPQATLDELVVKAADAAGDRLSDRLTVLDADLRSEINRQFGTVDTMIATAIGAATPDITGQVLGEVRGLVDDATSGLSVSLGAELRSEFDAGLAGLSESVGEKLNSLQGDLAERVIEVVAEVLPEHLREVDGRITSLEKRTDEVEQVALRADDRSAGTATRVEQINREGTLARAELKAEIGRELDDIRGKIGIRVDEAVLTARTAMLTSLKSQVGAMRRSIETELAAKAAEAARTEVRLMRGQLDANVRDLVQDELVATRTELSAEADRRMAATETRIDGLVATEVRRATQSMNQLIRAEVESQLTVIRPTGPSRPGGQIPGG